MGMEISNGRHEISSFSHLHQTNFYYIFPMQEFTSFTVEKANLLNKRAKLTSIAHYYDSSDILDPSAKYRHRHDISKFINIPSLKQFAVLVTCYCLSNN